MSKKVHDSALKKTALQAAREARGLSVEAVAKKVGICPAYLRQIETGARAPGYLVATQLGKLLEFNFGSLIFDAAKKKR